MTKNKSEKVTNVESLGLNLKLTQTFFGNVIFGRWRGYAFIKVCVI